MKVLVTGAEGQLGSDIVKCLAAEGYDVKGIDLGDCDITAREEITGLLEREDPDAVIHCAAYTAVDRAEDEPEKCFAVNAKGTENIALYCGQRGKRMIYFSTEYVFPGDGDRPYAEDDETGPLNVYGMSKEAGERTVRENVPEHFIIRISWAFSDHGTNFVKTMLRLSETRDTLKIVDDETGSPTYTPDVAEKMTFFLESGGFGTYNMTNEGFVSWYGFAEKVFELAGRDVRLIPVTTEEYGAKARRPLNSRLSKDKLASSGAGLLPSWEDALERCINSLLNVQN
ncbi:MAG: dTDP-4-dehydrorhamnose reductase [Lachnospiraceae bacterium]|nr:dTDP-4-dehydrorhamnose reductase [Lachnospiraceae bacterium]